MAGVGPASPLPTDRAALAALLSYTTHQRGLDWHPARPKRGVSTLAASVPWLCLVCRSSVRPYQLSWRATRHTRSASRSRRRISPRCPIVLTKYGRRLKRIRSPIGDGASSIASRRAGVAV